METTTIIEYPPSKFKGMKTYWIVPVSIFKSTFRNLHKLRSTIKLDAVPVNFFYSNQVYAVKLGRQGKYNKTTLY